jgi:hypothetical protein
LSPARRSPLSRQPVVLAALLAACGGPVDRPLDAAANWSIDAEPLLAIGGEALDTLAPLGNAVGAYSLDDGGVVVADRGYFGLRYFDATGNLVRQVGREGDGPSEFRYLGRSLRCGDSLLVHEMQQRRMMVFGVDGEFARSYPLTGPDTRFNYPYKLACAPSGRAINNGWDTLFVREYRRVRGTVPYWITAADGRVESVLGSFPGSERLAGPNGSGPHPLGKEPVLAAGRDRFYLGTADSFAIEVFAADGTPLPPITKQSVQLATTPEDIARDRLLDTLGKSDDDKAWEIRQWEHVEYPPTVPAYTAMVVDRDDNLWVRTFPRSAANVVRWVVFDPAGDEIGAVDLPATLEVHDIGPDWVLGIEVALDDGSQQVRRYRLRR